LWSIFHFTADQSKCRKSQLVLTNRFLIAENRWQSSEFLTEPQRNFHGCEMRVTIRQKTVDVRKVGNFIGSFFESENGTIQAFGINPKIIGAVARSSNFSIYHNAVGANNKQSHKYREGLDDDVDISNFQTTETSSYYLMYAKYIFLIPPGELYSVADKLIMPLKLEVWISTIVTILIALLIVQIINRMSQQVQNFVFGRNVTTPSLNIMIAFVGGGQSTLPRGNFARFLLTMFIIFSLIIRTCHQSKLYEYLQGDFVKSEITSIEELKDRNFTIYIAKGHTDFLNESYEFRNVIEYEICEVLELIEMTLRRDFHGAIVIQDSHLAYIETVHRHGRISLKRLKAAELGYFITFPHKPQSFLMKEINEMIGRFHSAGLVDFDLNKFFKMDKKPNDITGPMPLTMNHLKACFMVSCNYICHSKFEAHIFFRPAALLGFFH